MKTIKLKSSISKVIATAAAIVAFQSPLSAHSAQIHPEEVAGFEVLIAGKCSSSFQCAFGHSFLRIVNKHGPFDQDLVVGFTTPAPAEGQSAITYTANLITGSTLEYSVMNIRDVWHQYAVGEKREILRVPLQISNETRKNLIANINQMFFATENQKRMDPGGYTLLLRNCAGNIVRLLNQSGAPNEMFGIAIPANLTEHLYRTFVGNYPPIAIDHQAVMETQFDRLPADFYRFCEDRKCAQNVVSNYNNIWPGQTIEIPTLQKSVFYEESMNGKGPRTEPVHWNKQKPIVKKHYQLIQQEMQSPTRN